MDSILTSIANISQILSFIWLILLGSKTLFDFIKVKKLSIKPLFLTNIVLSIIILLMSSIFLSTHTKVPLNKPNNTLGEYTTLVNPTLPLSIPCELACSSKLTVILRGVYITAATNIELTFTLSNNGTNECTLIPKELKLTDGAGNISDAHGQIEAVGTISPNQTFISNADFTVAASDLYTLHTVLSCTSHETMIYQTEQLSFEVIIPERSQVTPTPPNLQQTVDFLCEDIINANFDDMYNILTIDAQGKNGKATIINTFGEDITCDTSSIKQNKSAATALIILTNPENQKSTYEFVLIHTSIGWKIQTWKQYLS